MTARRTSTYLNPPNELERFKRDVNLTELAASLGYRLVQREQTASGKWRGSSAASISMRHPDTDDKVIIRRDRDGHWTYFSVRSDADNGTVVDFLQHRGTRSLGAVREQLRAWLHEDRPAVPVELYRRDVAKQTHHEAVAATAYRRARAQCSRYLAERRIALDVERDPRLVGSYRVDGRGTCLREELFVGRRDPVCVWDRLPTHRPILQCPRMFLGFGSGLCLVKLEARGLAPRVERAPPRDNISRPRFTDGRTDRDVARMRP